MKHFVWLVALYKPTQTVLNKLKGNKFDSNGGITQPLHNL